MAPLAAIPLATYVTAASVAATVAGGAMSMMAQRQQAATKQAAMDYNAKVMREQAHATEMAGAAKEELVRQKGLDIVHQQNLLYGAGGVSTAEGTPLMIMADTAGKAELDALISGYETRIAANRYRAQADLDETMADQYASAGMWQMGGTLLSGAASAYNTYGSDIKTWFGNSSVGQPLK